MDAKNTHGFVTIGFVILLPVILSFSFCIYVLFYYLRTQDHAKNICRRELLSLQEEISRCTNELLALNPTATKLRYERKLAESSAEANPAYLAFIIAEQELLSIQQILLYQRCTLLAQSKPILIQRSIDQHLRNKLFLNSQTTLNVGYTPQWYKLNISPKSSPTPDYTTPRNFSEKQLRSIQWNFPTAAILPETAKYFLQYYLSKNRRNNFANLYAQCAATLIKENNQWRATLYEDRSSLNWRLL